MKPMANYWNVLAVLFAVGLCASPAIADTFSFTTIDDPSAPTNTSFGGTTLTGISGSTILGMYGSENYSPTAFLYNGSSFTNLDLPLNAGGGGVRGIDGANIVGTSLGKGFLYNGSTLTTINPPLAGNNGSVGDGISGNDIVGSYSDSSEEQHGFLYNGTSYVTLDDPFANSNIGQGTYATGISGNIVVGGYMDTSYKSHGFLYNINTASYTTFDVPSSIDTTIFGIDGNEIVGSYTDSSYNDHGFFYNGQTFTTLDDPFAGVNGTIANGVSGNTVVGYYFDSSNAEHGFVATIVPEPSTFALLSVGAVALIGYRWNRRKNPKS